MNKAKYNIKHTWNGMLLRFTEEYYSIACIKNAINITDPSFNSTLIGTVVLQVTNAITMPKICKEIDKKKYGYYKAYQNKITF